MTIRSLRCSVAMLVLAAGLAAACDRAPDTRLHPDAPAVTYAPERHPFRNATLFRSRDTAAARWQSAHAAGWLSPITRQPEATWLNGPADLATVPAAAAHARAQHALAVFVAYDIPNRGCGNFQQGAPDATAYRSYVDRLIAALGRSHAVIIMEPDAIAADCFNAERAAELRQATQRLTAAGDYVYLDAGHPKWRSTGDMAVRLLQAGIQNAEGFAVNVANRQSTQDSYAWARELSDLVGGREFVIDTSRNGSGPPPGDPADAWCNPAQQSLGSPPSTLTRRPGLAALLWIKDPGESDGKCGGSQTYGFDPAQARTLIMRTAWLSKAQRAAAIAARPAPVIDGG